MLSQTVTQFSSSQTRVTVQGTTQLDLLDDVAAMLQNDKHGYWNMVNGYCLETSREAFESLAARLQVSDNHTHMGIPARTGFKDRFDGF